MDTINYQILIEEAIINEQAAHLFYIKAAEKAKDPIVKRFFIRLSQEELQHKTILENILHSDQEALQFGGELTSHISESIESPSLEETMSFKEAVALAMKKEEEAADLYTGLARQSIIAAQQHIFTELAKMEAEHKEGLEDLYINSAYVEVW
jgi:rubrerythrin